MPDIKNKEVILLSRGKSLLGTHDVENKFVVDLDKVRDYIVQGWKAVFGREPKIEIDKDVDGEGNFSVQVDNSYYIYLASVKLSDEEMFAHTLNLGDVCIGGDNEVLRLGLGAIMCYGGSYWEPPDYDDVDIAYSVSLMGIVSELIKVEVNRALDNVWEGISYAEAFADDEEYAF